MESDFACHSKKTTSSDYLKVVTKIWRNSWAMLCIYITPIHLDRGSQLSSFPTPLLTRRRLRSWCLWNDGKMWATTAEVGQSWGWCGRKVEVLNWFQQKVIPLNHLYFRELEKLPEKKRDEAVNFNNLLKQFPKRGKFSALVSLVLEQNVNVGVFLFLLFVKRRKTNI